MSARDAAEAATTAGTTAASAGDRGSDARRFGIRSALALTAVLAGAVPFFALWLTVQGRWAPLAALDGDVAAGLNAAVAGSPALVSTLRLLTDAGGTGTAVWVLALTTAFLGIRGERRLAYFVAVTGAGLAVLVPLTKALADRARPLVDQPLVETPGNASFPSGHAMTSLVTWGVLVLLALPAVRRRWHPLLIGGAALLVLVVGFTRLALGVHFVSDVLAGYALGAAWLAAMTAAFRGWQHDTGSGPGTSDGVHDPLEVGSGSAAQLATVRNRPGRDRVRTALRLAGPAALLWAVLSAAGLLVTATPGASALVRGDLAVVRWFAEARSDTWTTLADLAGTLGDTRTVVAGGVGLAVLGLAVTRRWWPALFVATALLGEVLLYFLVAVTVERARPDVADLTDGLPVGASWPSGHVAAATVLYGAAAVLVLRLGRTRRRWLVLAAPVLAVPAVALSRIYVAAHHPTDVLAGAVLGTGWLLICWMVLQRGERSEGAHD
ncbi:phosphatase PAP2 family protein [Blastococcus sp. LR1]|uniref:phosphatase PAP2 family protein n=1 Tax=Blastococcus sp. LR1 TaxID=2877000 RepID=UPI001CCB7556|nr:phosphatase PAP2 family protein [Blastococcus sp. LR1]MCA0145218.1 phosphatase PAP2 family protein [Blastococcus sp. LR1]